MQDTDRDIEFSEAKLTLQTVTDENAALRQQITLAQDQIKSLTESLAIANSEAEVFRRDSQELKLKMEALGIETGGADKARLEQRVLKAVRDLQLVQNDKDKMADELVRLCEALLRFLKTAVTTDAQARMQVEQEMRAATEILGMAPPHAVEAEAAPASLTDAMVISVKEEYALVVANVGGKAGVKIGMPFQVWRGESRVGEVRVVDVRDRISGAVIQDLVSGKEKIKVGDRLRVDAQ